MNSNEESLEALTQENTRLKRINRVLRTVNGLLRRQETGLRQSADTLFLTICEVDRSAEAALGELWGSGEFNCSPQDYPHIVERCLAAIREYNESRITKCNQQESDVNVTRSDY